MESILIFIGYILIGAGFFIILISPVIILCAIISCIVRIFKGKESSDFTIYPYPLNKYLN